MRSRLALLLTAVLVALMAGPAAAYPPGSPAVSGAKDGAGCDVSPTEVTCVVVKLADGSAFKADLSFQASGPNRVATDAAAIAFVGAQGAITVTITGTADASGVGRGSAKMPAGVDLSKGYVMNFEGTAEDGTPITFSKALAAPATTIGDTGDTGDTGTAEPTTPATGAESGTLALIALALVGAGGSAVVLARRKSRIEA